MVSPEEVSSEEVQRIHIENQVLKRQLLDLQDKHDRARSEQNNAQRLLHNTRQECERLRAELSKFRLAPSSNILLCTRTSRLFGSWALTVIITDMISDLVCTLL